MKKPERLRPVMPKATAVWLIDNTSLSFQQIADSCELHVLEIQAMADAQEGIATIQGENPVASGQLTQAEIARCEKDTTAVLAFQDPIAALLPEKKKERRYTPRAYRQSRPDAIAWMLKHYPELSDSKICKLLSTTSKTVQAVRQKTHMSSATIKPRHPVLLGLCTEPQLRDVTRFLKPLESIHEDF